MELKNILSERNYKALAINTRGELLGTTTKENEVQVWNVTKNQMVTRFSHRDYVYATAFSPSGSVLATASDDGTAGLWDPRTGQSLAILRHGDKVFELVFSSDGSRLATGTDGEMAYVWRVHTQDLADQACQIAGRNLTSEEWAQYLGGQPYRKTCPQWS